MYWRNTISSIVTGLFRLFFPKWALSVYIIPGMHSFYLNFKVYCCYLLGSCSTSHFTSETPVMMITSVISDIGGWCHLILFMDWPGWNFINFTNPFKEPEVCFIDFLYCSLCCSSLISVLTFMISLFECFLASFAFFFPLVSEDIHRSYWLEAFLFLCI
jgi:hypothetical protein